MLIDVLESENAPTGPYVARGVLSDAIAVTWCWNRPAPRKPEEATTNRPPAGASATDANTSVAELGACTVIVAPTAPPPLSRLASMATPLLRSRPYAITALPALSIAMSGEVSIAGSVLIGTLPRRRFPAAPYWL